MPFGHSIPIAAPLGGFAGWVAGEFSRAVVKELGGGRGLQSLAAGVAHATMSATVSSVVNAAMLDPTGAAATPATSLGGAALHATYSYEFGELFEDIFD